MQDLKQTTQRRRGVKFQAFQVKMLSLRRCEVALRFFLFAGAANFTA
jgi:hypothetical protein